MQHSCPNLKGFTLILSILMPYKDFPLNPTSGSSTSTFSTPTRGRRRPKSTVAIAEYEPQQGEDKIEESQKPF